MNTFPRWLRTGLLGIVLAGGVMTAALAQGAARPAPGTSAQATFATPDDAVAALIEAVKQGNVARLRAVFGPGSKDLVDSGDKVADAEGRTRFVDAYAERHELVAAGPDRMVLDVGPNAWPMPIPLVKRGDRWQFDATAGAQELVNRRIGRNELATISSALAYVDAQKAYFALTGKAGHAEYAQRVISTKGRHDGLYWPAAADQAQSPLAGFVAKANAEGYPIDIVSSAPAPYHGYRYHVLKAQGPNAPGGAKSYIVGGRMTGGFALVAWPASYGASGVMTFIVDQDGVVFQRDLGPDTARIAAAMQRYDPDLHWARVDIVGQ